MDSRGLAVVLDRVISCLESKDRRIDSETYEQLFRGITEVLAYFADRATELSELRNATYAMRNYDRAYLLEGFDIGACWGAMKVVEAYERQEGDAEAHRQCLDKLRSKEQWRILEVIGNQPGITQGELASELGKSPSNLSQMLSRILPYRLVAIAIDGRRRRYSLTAYGREVLHEIKGTSEPAKELNGATHAGMDPLKTHDVSAPRCNESNNLHRAVASQGSLLNSQRKVNRSSNYGANNTGVKARKDMTPRVA